MKTTIIMLAMTTLSLCGFSQDTVYFSKEKTSATSQKHQKSSQKNIVKIAPLAFISGYVPVYYERELTSFLSIQLGAGITTRNYWKELTK